MTGTLGTISGCGGATRAAGATLIDAGFLGVTTADFAMPILLGLAVSIALLGLSMVNCAEDVESRAVSTGKLSFAIGATAGSTTLVAAVLAKVDGTLPAGANDFGLNDTALNDTASCPA